MSFLHSKFWLVDKKRLVSGSLSLIKFKKNSLNNKIAIVTGATSGFGLLTALKLAGTHFVIATARHPEKAEALRNRIAELSI